MTKEERNIRSIIKSWEKSVKTATNEIIKIKKHLAKGENDWQYNETVLKDAEKELERCKSKLAKYQVELNEILKQEEKKPTSRNVPAITEFLNNWEQRVIEYYTKGIDEVFAEKNTITKEEYKNNLYGTFEKVKVNNGHYAYTKKQKAQDGKWEWVKDYIKDTYEESITKLTTAVAKEKEHKYDTIIKKTTAIVGTITDATNLTIGDNGELNGIIIGTKSKANVITIGAGGYNIQCYHFRTLIKEIK